MCGMSAWFRTVVRKGVRCVRYKMLNLFGYRSKVIGLIYTLSVVVVFGWLLSHIPIYHDIKTTVFVYLVAIVSALIGLVLGLVNSFSELVYFECGSVLNAYKGVLTCFYCFRVTRFRFCF